MAKKDTGLDDIFKKTDPGGKSDPGAAEPSGPTITRGVGLKQSEWEEMEAIAARQGPDLMSGKPISLHAVTRYAIRYFLKDYRDGQTPLK